MSHTMPMKYAPRDGRRILLQYWPKHFDQRSPTYYSRAPEPKWQEMFYKDGQWCIWTGNPRVWSTGSVKEEDCIRWMYCPA